LDTALALENRVAWLIIDVEGYEVNVLNAARSILQKYSPKIIIEAHHVDKVKEILKSERYRIPLFHIITTRYKMIFPFHRYRLFPVESLRHCNL
jgi:hypothetical protein